MRHTTGDACTDLAARTHPSARHVQAQGTPALDAQARRLETRETWHTWHCAALGAAAAAAAMGSVLLAGCHITPELQRANANSTTARAALQAHPASSAGNALLHRQHTTQKTNAQHSHTRRNQPSISGSAAGAFPARTIHRRKHKQARNNTNSLAGAAAAAAAARAATTNKPANVLAATVGGTATPAAPVAARAQPPRAMRPPPLLLLRWRRLACCDRASVDRCVAWAAPCRVHLWRWRQP